MTIRKGQPWGEPAERPADLFVAASDAELSAALLGDLNRPIGVSAGDLHRSIGSPPDRREMQRLPVDALQVTADGVRFTAVAHVVVRRNWWRGRVVAAMNVDHLGSWNVAPRAHPNDGRLDLVEVDVAMRPRERWQAKGRLPAGTHVPHPRIRTLTATEVAWEFDRPHGVWIDGVRRTKARSVAVAVEPDAFVILV
jgi:YegS C-terminal NAD kinase beta sandwich-like domain